MKEKENNEKKINGYTLSRQWFDFAFENPDKISPVHGILYFWLIELNNELGWKKKFGLPTYHSMEAIGVQSYKTYKKAFEDLVSWGFVFLVQKAKNNHTSNVIELVNFTKSVPSQLPTDYQVTPTIDKQEETIKTIYNVFYDSEIEKNNDENYKAFVKFLFGEVDLGRPFNKLLKMNDQIDYEKFLKLKEVSEQSGQKIYDKCRALENSTKKYVSLYLTLNNWLKNVR